MPGGFARVGSTRDATAIAMQRGGQAADVWVVSARPVERVSLLPAGRREAGPQSLPASLPSRAADNLIWLGRYVERCEATVRILRAYNARLAEVSNPDLPILKDTRTYLDSIGVDAREALPPGLLAAIDSAVAQRRPDPRPLLARRLAGADRPAQDRQPLRRQGAARRRRHPRDDRAAAQARRLLRPGAREHVPLRRLALPRDRPPPRARHPDRRDRQLVHPPGRAGGRARHAARDRRQRHDPPPPLFGGRRRQQLHRPAGARPAQPALGAVPGRRTAPADRAAARRHRGRPPVAGGQGGAGAAHRAARGGAGGAGLPPSSTGWPWRSAGWPISSPTPTSREASRMLYDIRLALHYDYDGCGAWRSPPRPGDAGRPSPACSASSPRRCPSIPSPTTKRGFSDFFGNSVTSIAYHDYHDHLDVRLSARVQRRGGRAACRPLAHPRPTCRRRSRRCGRWRRTRRTTS